MIPNNIIPLLKKESYIQQQLDENFISQRSFSKLLGLDRSHLIKIIKRKHRPQKKTIKLIAMGLSRLDNQDWKDHARAIQDESR